MELVVYGFTFAPQCLKRFVLQCMCCGSVGDFMTGQMDCSNAVTEMSGRSGSHLVVVFGKLANGSLRLCWL